MSFVLDEKLSTLYFAIANILMCFFKCRQKSALAGRILRNFLKTLKMQAPLASLSGPCQPGLARQMQPRLSTRPLRARGMASRERPKAECFS
ncbi:conserved protein of unknown function [Ectopseudomonas oleovorans]|uniref:Uncharacterized protein n=1 Tax=Ectopseudomonas oleovorans TaxID=301 RepID=A0A653BBK4_ECTOL|nr:conserved protein of unknown function [Pseudomonas oleovorans]